MTARDEATRDVLEFDETLTEQYARGIVDAIPGDVLVRLAIERGALVGFTQSEWCDPDTDVAGDDVLYRVVVS